MTMPRLYEHRTLDLGRDLFVCHEFHCNGRTYARGMLFDWRRCAVEERLVRMLWDQGSIDNDDPTLVKPARAAAPVETPAPVEPAPAEPLAIAEAAPQPTNPRPGKRR